MSNAYDELPESVDRSQVADAVREIITSYMEERDLSYKKLARRVSRIVNLVIGDAAIRQFLIDGHRSRINAGNTTLPALYNFIVADYHRFPSATRSRYFDLREDLGLLAPPAVDDAMFAIGTQRWVHASKPDVLRIIDKLEGTFIAIRRSTVNAKYIKSVLHLKRARSKGQFWIQAVHEHIDRSMKLRMSDGFVFPVVRNIYVPMQVEGHEGMEIIVIREPVQAKPEFLMGFMFGLNANRNVYNSSLLLERLTAKNRDVWDHVSPRFARDHAQLPKLGKDFLYRLDQVITETRSQLLSRFDNEETDET